MSSYRIYSPIYVKKNANTLPGQISVYNGSTNYTSIKANAELAVNTNFTLPSSIGTVSQYISTDGSGGLSFANGKTSCLPINMKVKGNTALTPATIAVTTFTIVSHVFWRGTEVEGTPSSVNVVLSGTSTNAEVRVTNLAAGVSALRTGLSLTATPTIYNVPITGGFLTGERTVQLETRVVSSGNISCWFWQVVP